MEKANENLTELVPSEDYYIEHGLIVMTAAYHLKRGHCCGSGCRWCPYAPKHQHGATTISDNSGSLPESKFRNEHQSQ